MKTSKQWAAEWIGCEVNFETFIETIQRDAQKAAAEGIVELLQEHWGHEIVRALGKRIAAFYGLPEPQEPFHVERLHPSSQYYEDLKPPLLTPPEVLPDPEAKAEVETDPALAAGRSSAPPNPQTSSLHPSQEPSPKPSEASCPIEKDPPAAAPAGLRPLSEYDLRRPPALKVAWEGTLPPAAAEPSSKAPDPRCVQGGYLPPDVRLDLHSEELKLSFERVNSLQEQVSNLEKGRQIQAGQWLEHDDRLKALENGPLSPPLGPHSKVWSAWHRWLYGYLDPILTRLEALEKKWEAIPLADEPPRCQATRDFAPGFEGQVCPAEAVWVQGKWQLWSLNRPLR